MKKAYLFTTLAVITLLVGLALKASAKGGCGDCGLHCQKISAPGPFWFDVEAWGQNESTIKSVLISAGEMCSVFTSNGQTDCYEVSGIGGKVATASLIGGAADCQHIDYVLFNWKAPFLTLTPEPTNTPPPTWPSSTITPEPETPTPTIPFVTLPPRDTPTPTTTPEVTNTPPPTWPPPPTRVPTDTPTPPPTEPAPKSGSIRLFGYCVYPDGSHGVEYDRIWMLTDNMGELNGYAWPPVGHVGTWDTARDTGTTVLDAGPGTCFRGGDDYPVDQTRHDLQAQPIFGAGNVGNGAVVCERPCVSTTQTFNLPESGGVHRATCGNRR